MAHLNQPMGGGVFHRTAHEMEMDARAEMNAPPLGPVPERFREPKRLALFALTGEALAEILGLAPGHAVVEMRHNLDDDLFRLKVRGPDMPEVPEGAQIMYKQLAYDGELPVRAKIA